MIKLLSTTAIAAAFMSDTVPTVTVKGEDGEPLLINESDYDPDKYEMFDGSAPATNPDNSDADGLPETKAELEKLAVSEGIDLEKIAGTGANGNVLKDDVIAAIKAKRTAAVDTSTNPPPAEIASATITDTNKPTLVDKVGDRYFATDANGARITGNAAIDEAGYKTDQAAWAAITAANAPAAE